jgi:hypothetical protein
MERRVIRIQAVLAAMFLSSTLSSTTTATARAAAKPASCKAPLTIADARALAVATPNARAFVADFGATLKTTVRSQTATTATIVVTARDTQHGTVDVDIYTINLRTGTILDDAMEEAEDGKTVSLRNKLMAAHCK